MVNSAKTCQQTPLSTRRFDSHQACCSPCCRLYGTIMGHVLYPALRNPDLFFPLQRFVYAQKLECTRANCFLETPSCNSGGSSPRLLFLRSSCRMRIAVAVITALLTVLGFLALDVLCCHLQWKQKLEHTVPTNSQTHFVVSRHNEEAFSVCDIFCWW